MATNKQNNGAPFQDTDDGSTSATATEAASTGYTHYITDVCAGSDKAGSVIIVYDGSTEIWQAQVGAGNFTQSFVQPLKCTSGSAASVTIDGTSACYANIAGFTLKQ